MSNINFQKKKKYVPNKLLNRKTSLKKQMVSILALGMIISSLFSSICALIFIETDIYYIIPKKLEGVCFEYICNDLENYIKDNNISSTDYLKIREWNDSHEFTVDFLYIFEGEKMLYSSYVYIEKVGDEELRYLENLSKSSKDLVYEYEVKNKNIKFKYSKADVYIALNIASYTQIFFALVIIMMWIIVFVLFFIHGVKKEISYINLLSSQVDNMDIGNLDTKFSIKGNNEITNLANTLNTLINNLQKKEEKELEMIQAQKRLVTGMAHDLRTPMTALLNYAEILKRCDDEEKYIYIEKIKSKTMELKSLSDQMFEYFYVSGENLPNDFKIDAIEFSLGDYLSELFVLLENEGFHVLIEDLSWEDRCIEISPILLGRVMNNIFSNVVKYASKKSPIYFYSDYDGKSYSISIKNSKLKNNTSNDYSTKIGVNNISMMMGYMNGKCKVNNDSEEYYVITLSFKIVEQQ